MAAKIGNCEIIHYNLFIIHSPPLLLAVAAGSRYHRQSPFADLLRLVQRVPAIGVVADRPGGECVNTQPPPLFEKCILATENACFILRRICSRLKVSICRNETFMMLNEKSAHDLHTNILKNHFNSAFAI